jgi:hypothetical protein
MISFHATKLLFYCVRIVKKTQNNGGVGEN